VAGTYGQRFPVAPPVPSATTDIPLGAPNPPLGKNTAAAAESARDLDLFLGFSSEEGAHRFSPQSGGTVATSTGVMTGNPSVMGVLEGSAVGDVNDVLGDDLTPFLDGELGHGILDIHENFQNAFDMNAEDINDSPLIDSEEESAGRSVRPYTGFPLSRLHLSGTYGNSTVLWERPHYSSTLYEWGRSHQKVVPPTRFDHAGLTQLRRWWF